MQQERAKKLIVFVLKEYGKMIACDNLNCPIEWFHFGCVGLSSKPRGQWFCMECSDHFC